MMNSLAADFRFAYLDHRLILAEFAADKLVGGRDAHGAFDTGRGFQRFEASSDVATDAHHSDDHAFRPGNRVHSEPELLDPFSDVIDFLFGRVRLH